MGSFEESCTPDHATSELRFPSTWADNGAPFEEHPRAVRRKLAIDQLARALRSSDDMAPSEIFDACCESVATALDLATAVVIEGFDGIARSLSWKNAVVDWTELSLAEGRAWEVVKDRSLSPADCRAWRVVALAPPLRGILYCVGARSLDDDDLALLEYMAARLSFALYRYDLQWEHP